MMLFLEQNIYPCFRGVLLELLHSIEPNLVHLSDYLGLLLVPPIGNTIFFMECLDHT